MTKSDFRKKALSRVPFYRVKTNIPCIELDDLGETSLRFALDFYKKLKDRKQRDGKFYFPIAELVSSLYVLEMMIASCKDAFDPQLRHLKKHQDEIVNQLDNFFISYTLVAVSGELRYALEDVGEVDLEWNENIPKLKAGLDWKKQNYSNGNKFTEKNFFDIFKRLSKLGVNYINSENVKHERESIHSGTLNIKQENYGEVLGWFRMLLNQFSWPDGCGGKPWFDIFETVIARLEGKYSPMIFVDRCLDLEHNNGCYLDKTRLINPEEVSLIPNILDEKREAENMKELVICVLNSQTTIRNLAIKSNFKGVMKKKMSDLLQYTHLTKDNAPLRCQKCHKSFWGWSGILSHSSKKKHFKYGKG